MPLTSGTRIGHFEVVAPLGAGGMGEVYRARDLNLGRDVALKVLPADVAGDPTRLARFDSEARAAAALNHPNILVVFEVGVGEQVQFVAAELLLGHTLTAELHQPIPLPRAVDYATQIARGLAAAHDQNIVHRDIKPDNLFVTRDGLLKILDFGIAKVVDDEWRNKATMTVEGLAVGTGGYMAPEQVRGAAVDARADLFALGAVFYEMLTGQSAFPGNSTAERLAAVLHFSPPGVEAAAPGTPRSVARIVHRCLEKEPTARFQSARDLVFALEGVLQPDEGIPTRGVRGPWMRRAVLAAVGILIAFMTWQLAQVPPEADRLTRRLQLGMGATSLSSDVYVPFAVSPDGSTMAFVAGQPQRLFVRRFDRATATEMPGTEDAYDPFFSPDGRWIGFLSSGALKKVPVAGGAPVALCQSGDLVGASWGDDGTIVFAPGVGEGLMVVSSEGGTPKPLTVLDESGGEVVHSFPQVLSEGRGVLFTVQRRVSGSGDAGLSVELFEPRTGSRRPIVSGARYGRLLRSGHLAFVRQRALLAVTVAAGSLAFASSPVTLVDDIQVGPAGSALYATADDGTFAYVPFEPPPSMRLVWVDRAGMTTDTGLPARPYLTPRLSPDGRLTAVRLDDPPTQDLWVGTFATGALERLTFARRLEYTFSAHTFFPDGSKLAYAEDAPAGTAVKVLSLDGTPPRTLFTWPRRIGPGQVTRQGILLSEVAPTTGGDVLWLPNGASAPEPLVREPGNQWQGGGAMALSPDHRMLAYVSDESGRFEIYVRPFSGDGPKRQVTMDGGTEVTWSRDGRELFFRHDGRLMTIAMTPAGRPSGVPRTLFDDRFEPGAPGQPGYDVGPDGRFLMMRAVAQRPARELRVVLNWLDEVKRLAP